MMVASIIANDAPIQIRGPAPNGMYWKRFGFDGQSGAKRFGSKRSGFPKSSDDDEWRKWG